MKNKFLFPFIFILTIMLSACSSAGAISTYTIYLDDMPQNFDPQVADTDSEILVLSNIYDGLFEYIDGAVVPNVCSSYTVSGDGLTYNFTLRQDSSFYLGKGKTQTVTAADFAFGINRVLDAKTRSPYRSRFQNIAYAKATGTYQLEIGLKAADSDFLYKLTLPGAYPCNEEFFSNTNGAYGLRVNDILSNGPYTISYLADDDNSATLVRVDENKSAVSRIRIFRRDGADDIKTLYQTDKASGFFAAYDEIKNLSGKVYSYENQNFSMVLNPDVQSLSNQYTRGALAYYSYSMENSGANLAAVNPSRSLFNRSVLLGGSAVCDLMAEYTPGYMSQNPKEMLNQGLEQAGLAQMEKLTILIPEDIKYSVIAENINQLWQKNLGLFFSVQYLPNSEIAKRVEDGDFDIAFVSSQPASSSPAGILQPYSVYGGEIAGHIAALQGASDSLQHIECCHNDILEGAYIVPMCTDSRGYIHKSYFDNVAVNPFGSTVNLKYASVK